MLVFAVQVFASSLCISTTAQAVETVSLEHCHQSMEHSGIQHEMSSMQAQPMQEIPMSACSHCASPDDFAIFVNDVDASPADLLLAFIVLETIPATSSAALPNFVERAQAPPNSSSTLYTTTQRIRI